VLPFASPDHDPEQAFFVDGMSEDLITDLSRVSGLNVIARNSVFTYKGLSPRAQEVAQQLAASYVLEGSVRKLPDRVHVNVEFIDASTGLNLWGERFDGGLEDLFRLQDRVARRIVAAFAIHLTKKERDGLARHPTTNLQALRRYFLGCAYYGQCVETGE
jgi:adenylate cyclase